METQKINQKLRNAIKLRHLVDAITENWGQATSVKKRVQQTLDNATNYIESYGSDLAKQNYSSKINRINSNISEVEIILNQAYLVITGKSNDVTSIKWGDLQTNIENIETLFISMENFEESSFINCNYSDWKDIWKVIKSNLYIVKGLSNSSFVQLKMMETFDKEELDILTNNIIKNIPRNFSILEAEKYEKEYIEAMESIEKEANAKSNLWDRFLNLLAGAVPFKQTPAERVMMQRWLDGDKGDL
ncbi:MAG TPA: hypothetical protein PKZ75_04140 [Bacteroidia bacterium]|nr:hypothetical protein [Bacteroidia bacterium]